MGSIKTIIVDENALYRSALTELLTVNGIHVIGQAANEKALFKQMGTEVPDILMYDFFNSVEPFADTVAKLRRVAPETKLLVLSFETNPALIEFCLSNGAKGFYDKRITDSEYLISGLKKIAEGNTVVY